MVVDLSAVLVLLTSVVLTTAIAIEGFIARMVLENRSRIIKLEEG